MRVIWFFSLVVLAQADTIYSVTDLGSLGGSSTAAFRINASGTAVGWGATPDGDQSAFISDGFSLQTLQGPVGSSDTYAYGINSAGVIVGTSYVNGQPHGEIWNGAATDLGAGVYAMGVSDSGVVVGGQGHAFLFSNGVYQDLGALPGGDWSAAYGVNSAGTVVGYGNISAGTFRAFVWTPSAGMVALGTLGGLNSYATDVNDAGEIVGHASLSNGYEHAFAESNGVMTDLGTLGGSSYAYGINSNGEIVGYSYTDSGDSHAFVHFNGALQDLNSMIGAGSGWDLLEAYGVNDSGEIVGEGMLDGQAHAFLLDPETAFSFQAVDVQPVPEPRGAALACILLGLVLAFARPARRSL